MDEAGRRSAPQRDGGMRYNIPAPRKASPLMENRADPPRAFPAARALPKRQNRFAVLLQFFCSSFAFLLLRPYLAQDRLTHCKDECSSAMKSAKSRRVGPPKKTLTAKGLALSENFGLRRLVLEDCVRHQEPGAQTRTEEALVPQRTEVADRIGGAHQLALGDIWGQSCSTSRRKPASSRRRCRSKSN